MENIDLDHKLEYKGYWWLPTDPDNKVAGVLTYYPNEKIVLGLLGCFGEYSLAILTGNDQEDIIYGKTAENKEITLINNIRALKLNFSADFPIVRYTCNYMVIGKHVKGLDEKRSYWATVRIPELTYWCQPGAITTTMFFDKKNNSKMINMSFSTEFRSRKDILNSIKVNENTSVKIKKAVRYNGDHFAPEVEQYSCLEIRKKGKTSIKEIVSDIFMFEQFLSLATLSIVKSSRITLYDKSTYQQEGKTRFYREIHFIHAFRERNNLQSAETKMFKSLFDYSAIKDVYPEIITKWYNEPIELAPIRDHLISSLEKKQLYSSVDFLIVIQALEGFCRRFRSRKYRKKHGLPERDYSDLFAMMGSLLDEFGDIELIQKCKIDKEAVVDSRNYYSHFMPKDKDSKALDGFELYELTMRLRILLICCVLSLYGFENSRINEIMKKSHSKVLEL
jgi:hypothetical protein